MAYEAGKVFLQVIPSYDNFQRTIAKDVKADGALGRQMARDAEQLGAQVDEGMAKGVRKGKSTQRAVAETVADVDKTLKSSNRAVDSWSKNLVNRIGAARQVLGQTNKEMTRGLREFEDRVRKGALTTQQAERVYTKYAKALAKASEAGESTRGRSNNRAALRALTGDAAEARKFVEAEKRALAESVAATKKAEAEKRRELEKSAREYERLEREITDFAAKEDARRLRRKMRDQQNALAEAEKAAKAEARLYERVQRERARAEDAAMKRAQRLQAMQEAEAIRAAQRQARHAETMRMQAERQGFWDERRASRDRDRDAPSTNVAARSVHRFTGFLTGNRDAQDGANAFRAFNAAVLLAVTLGTALVPVLAAIGGGVAALIPVLLGAATGLGVFAFAVSGIKGAVEALAKQQDASSGSSRQYQNQVQSAARAAQRAGQQVERAERNLAKAQRAVADARRSAARTVQDAIERQKRAEEGLIEAQQRAVEAQQDLVDARRQAIKDLRDLENRVAQNRLDERSGVIDVFNAEQRYNAVMADPGATNLEREQASIDLEQAQLSLKQTRQEQQDLAEDKAKADRDGVNGTDRVVRAQEALNDAIRDERDARKDVADAARDLDEARADGARRVRDALEGVRDAEEALTNARQDAADAQGAYNDAIAGGAAAVDEVALAMNKLSPAGRRFARFIFGLRDNVDRLRKSAQEALLPGLQSSLESLLRTYSPGFSRWVREMSGDLGELAVVLGRRFEGGGFPTFFREWGQASRQFTADALMGTVNLLEAFGNIFVVARPFLHAFSNWLLGVSERFRDWTASERGQNSLVRFFEYLRQSGREVIDFLSRSAPGFTAIAVALGTIGSKVLEAFGWAMERLGELDQGKVTAIVAGLIGLVMAFQLSTGLVALIAGLGVLLGAPYLAAAGAVAGLATAFYLLGDDKHLGAIGRLLEPVLTIFRDLWSMVKDNLMKTWNEVLLPGFEKLVRILNKDFIPSLRDFWEVIRPFVRFLVNTLGEMLRGALSGVFDILGGLLTFLGGLMDVITGIFTGDWGKVWSGIKKIGRGLWNIFKGIFKLIFWLGPLKLIKVGGKLITSLVGRIFSKGIPGTLTLAWAAIRLGISRLFTKMRGLFGKGVSGLVKLFNRVKNAVKNLLPESVLRALQKAFKKLSGHIMDPIKFAINVVINGGIFKAIRWIKKQFGIGDASTPKNITFGDSKDTSGANARGGRDRGYATGGIAGLTRRGGVLPGYTPGRDVIDARLSGGEAIMRPEFTSAVGAGWVDQMNALARRGPATIRRAIGGGIRRFARGGIVWPTTTKSLSGDYPGHTGVDIRAPHGSPVFAAHAGRVSQAHAWNYSYGHHLRIKGTDGVETIYAHLSRLMAKVGQMVKAGTQIGLSGNTGNSRGPHLHFEVRPGMTRGAALAYLGNGTIPKGGKGGDAGPNLWERLNPLARVRKIFAGAREKMGALGEFGSMMAKIPFRMLKALVSWGKAKAGFGGKAPAKLYDTGGWIKPGYTTVHNASGRPEPVFSAQQWDLIRQSLERTTVGANGQRHYHWHDATSTSPEEFAAKLNRADRREARRTSSRLPVKV